MNLGHLLFSLSGRIGRRAFWLGALCLVILGVAVVTALKAGLMIVAAPLALAGLYVLACLNTKRLADINHSPWVQVLPWVLAFIPAFADTLMWAGRHAIGIGDIAGNLTLSVDTRMLVWFVAVFEAWLGLSRTKP